MSPRVARALHRTGRVALSVTAVVGVVCALLTVLALVTGVRPLVFRSGSMGPDVPAGSLGFSRSTDAADLKVGDVVTVTTKTDQKVTHRIVTVTPHDDVATLQLKGDANAVADEDLYQISSAPKLLFSVPEVGYTVNWLSHAPGSYLLALYVALMLVLVARRKDAGTPSAGTPVSTPGKRALTPNRSYLRPPILTEGALVTQAEPRGRGPRRALVASVVVALAVVGLTGFSQSTWAAWTDDANVSGSTISTGTFGPLTTCSVDNSKLTIVWKYPNASDTPNPDIKFIVKSNQNGTLNTPTDVAKTLRTWTSPTFNSTNGQVNVYAVNNGPVEVLIATVNFTFGNGAGGGNKSCSVVL